MLGASDESDGGVRDTGPDEVESFWLEIDPAESALVVEARDGSLVGYVDVTPAPGKLHIDGYIHPAARGQGVGVTLLRAAEELAAVGKEGELVLYTTIVNGADAAERLLEQEGYGYIRSWFRMRGELGEQPPAPEWPDGVAVRPYVRGRDDRVMHETLDDAFQDHWDYQTRPLEDFVKTQAEDKLLVPEASFLAADGNELAGAVLSKWQLGGGWIQSLGVRSAWRRRGLGLALLYQAFGSLYDRGARTVALGVDAESTTGATHLYERAGMGVDVRWDTYEKRLSLE